MNTIALTSNALRILEERYLRRDAERRITETPQQLFESVAAGVAYAELLIGNAGQMSAWQQKFYDMLAALDFLPNSPTLMNAGKPIGQLSACFVLPVEDSIEGIFETLKQMALVQRTGGGTGFSFSKLRPKGDVVASTSGVASGPVSFMKIFDCATENIKQGGKRRGANMGVLRVDHPDIVDFIRAKEDGSSLRNFNISVAVTDDFMTAVARGDTYELIHPNSRRAAGKLKAKEVFDEIARCAWLTGDPGLLFRDTINRFNPTPHIGSLEATNPCGEIPLLAYESCNLGSINLAHMIRPQNGPYAEVDWNKLRMTVQTAVRFLDNVIEVNKYSLPQIAHMTRQNRKIGLGVMGFAEMLIRLGIPYGSEKALAAAEQTMAFIAAEALKASQQLAEERNVFPHWPGSIYESRNMKVRNATQTAIAPTGTIGIIANTSSGIEPLFALAFKRSHVLGDQTLLEINPLVSEYLEKFGLDVDIISAQVVERGTFRDIEGLPEDMTRLFVTALELPPEKHLQVQAAFQRHVDNAVSKTINLPADATCQQVAESYWQAWKMGLKGITIYRYGSKLQQVLEVGAGEYPE